MKNIKEAFDFNNISDNGSLCKETVKTALIIENVIKKKEKEIIACIAYDVSVVIRDIIYTSMEGSFCEKKFYTMADYNISDNVFVEWNIIGIFDYSVELDYESYEKDVDYDDVTFTQFILKIYDSYNMIWEIKGPNDYKNYNNLIKNIIREIDAY